MLSGNQAIGVEKGDIGKLTNYLVPHEALVAVMGDSRAAHGVVLTPVSGGYTLTKKDPQGFSGFAEALTGGRARFPSSYNKAVSGSLVADLLGQWANVAALRPLPTHCAILTGTNTFGAGGDAPTAWAVLAGLIPQMLAAGVQPIIMLDLPRQLSSWVAADSQASQQFNQLIRINAPGLGALVVDPAYLLADPANVNGDPLAGYYAADGIHPTAPGGYQMGVVLANLFNAVLPPALPGAATRADAFNATYNPRGNIIPAPLFTGTGGTNTSSGGTASGTVADGWNNRTLTGTGTSTASIVARADGKPGNWQQLVLNSTGAGVSTYRFSLITAPTQASYYNVGDKLRLAMDVNITAANGLEQFDVLLQSFDGASTVYDGAQWGNDTLVSATRYPFLAFNGRCITDDLTITAQSTALLIRVEARVNNLSSTIQLGAAELRKVA